MASGQQVGIRLQGDWRKLRHKFQRYTHAGEHFAEETMGLLADIVKIQLDGVMVSEPEPRNARQTKYNKGFDRPLIELSSPYLYPDDNISIEVDKSKWETIFSVQGNPNKIHNRSGSSYEYIVSVNSKGDDGANIPARKMLPIAYSLASDDVKQLARKSLNDWLEG